MDFLDKEAQRKMEEFNRLKPNAEQQRIIDEMRRIEADPINRITREQARLATEAFGEFFLRERDYFRSTGANNSSSNRATNQK